MPSLLTCAEMHADHIVSSGSPHNNVLHFSSNNYYALQCSAVLHNRTEVRRVLAGNSEIAMAERDKGVGQCVYVMRHGERLDSIDRQWRNTAQRPYDTPLSQHGHHEAMRLVKQRLQDKVYHQLIFQIRTTVSLSSLVTC